MYAVFTRTLGALITAFGLAAALGPAAILLLQRLGTWGAGKRKGAEQPAVPLMGGVLVLFAVVITSLLWGHDSYARLLLALLLCATFCALGFAEDFQKTVGARGVRPWQKLVAELALALLFALLLYAAVGPTLWRDRVSVGFFYVPFAMLVILGTTNAVRLTEGPAGTVGTITVVYALAMSALLCVSVLTAKVGADPATLRDETALSAFCAAVAGGTLGFLVYGGAPARITLGESGTLLLGAAIAAIALLSGTALLLPLMGACCFVSAGSVVYGMLKNRLWGRETPTEPQPFWAILLRRGMAEQKLVSLYGIVTLICSAGALLLYWFLH